MIPLDSRYRQVKTIHMRHVRKHVLDLTKKNKVCLSCLCRLVCKELGLSSSKGKKKSNTGKNKSKKTMASSSKGVKASSSNRKRKSGERSKASKGAPSKKVRASRSKKVMETPAETAPDTPACPKRSGKKARKA